MTCLGASAGVADHVRIALDQTRVFRGVKACVHARQDGKLPAGGSGSLPLSLRLAA